MKKKNNTLNYVNTILLFLVVASLITGIFLFATDRIGFPTNKETTNTEFIFEEVLEDDLPQSCTLDFSSNNVCLGENFTATLEDGSDTHCYVFATDGTEWRRVYEGDTNAIGIWEEIQELNIEGIFEFRAICDKDNSGTFDFNDCITNAETLVVEDCTPPSYSDGEELAGNEGSTIITADGDQTIEIDMSSIGEGNCNLKAQLSYSWDYVDPTKCWSLQNQQSFHIEMWDSEKYIYDQTHLNPIGLVWESECGLVYDGVNDWKIFITALDVEGCEIEVTYDVKVLTCECT